MVNTIYKALVENAFTATYDGINAFSLLQWQQIGGLEIKLKISTLKPYPVVFGTPKETIFNFL